METITATSLRDFLVLEEQLMSQHRAGPAADHWAYPSLQAFVLANGREFRPAPLTTEEEWIVRRALRLMGERPLPQHCYYNAQALAASDPSGELHYVEGYTSAVIAIPHAWCELSGKVVDVTIEARRTGKWWNRWNLGTFDPERNEYFGVVFPSASAIVEARWKTGAGQPLIDDWRATWPLLQGQRLYGLPRYPMNRLPTPV